MEKNTLYVWVHPDFSQVDAPEINAWRRTILGLRDIYSSGLVLVPWDYKKIGLFNSLSDLCQLAYGTLDNRFFKWKSGQFIFPNNLSILPDSVLNDKKTAICYGLQPAFCVQDQSDYLKKSGRFNQVFNAGYSPENIFSN